MAEQLTAQQRAQYFNALTRTNEHMLPKQTATQPLTTLDFTYPKNRLLSKTHVYVSGRLKVTGASGTVTLGKTDIYKILARVSIDLNNGFVPYAATGEDIALLNTINMRGDRVFRAADSSSLCMAPNSVTATTAGANLDFAFMLDLSNTLNDRDIAGLVLLQNNETQVNLKVDIANPQILTNTSGVTITIDHIDVQPCLQTFTIPAVQAAFPDISVIKLVSARTESFVGAGQNIIRLNIGTIYRKLILRIYDEDGNPVNDSYINSNIELTFNQADTPYSITPQMLRLKNVSELGYELPKGVYVFDFSYNGFSNYSSTRDYIDTERLQEFWIKFSTTGAGKITIISENLTRVTA